jgi:isopropylmalate/homocitrate/citramalate synthase
MNRLFTFTSAAVLMAASVNAAYAAPNTGDQLSAKDAKAAEASLKLMDQQIAAISDNALVMNQAIDRTDDWEFQADRLAYLRDQVNKVGQEIAVIEGEPDSLPQWQTDAVDQIAPVLHEVAAEATQAINTFNADNGRLFASDYGTETKEISDNAGKVAQHLHDDLKLANAETVESRVTAALDKQNTAVPNSKPGI